MIRLLPLLFALAIVATAAGQAAPKADPKGTTAIAKAGLTDPFTKRDPKAMAALGVVDYAPLVWADDLRTTDIETVLGEGRLLWLETEHFKIGCSLGVVQAPKDPIARRLLKDELKRLNGKNKKLPSSASRLGPWVRLHLYAQRAEELYAEFAELAGFDEAGKHLGRDQKFLLLLFQQKSDLARYMDRFCGRKTEFTQTHYHNTGHHAVVLTAEGEDGARDAETVHAQFRYNLIRVFCAAAGNTPWWLSHGLSHWYERQVPCNLINCGIGDGESVDPATQTKWERKLKKRTQHDELVTPFAELCRSTSGGYYWHIQAWSRVDYMLQDRVRFAAFLKKVIANRRGATQLLALEEVYELEPEAFDVEWRKWVQKNYK